MGQHNIKWNLVRVVKTSPWKHAKIEADLKKKKFQVFISMNIQPDYIPMVSLLLTLLAIQKQPIQMMIKKA